MDTGHEATSMGTGHEATSTGTGHETISMGTGHEAIAMGTGHEAIAMFTGHEAIAMGTGHETSKVQSAELSETGCCRSGVSQNTAWHVLPTARNSTLLISASVVHSTSFPPITL